MLWCGLIYAQSNTETCRSRRRYHLPNSYCHLGSTMLVKMHPLVFYPFHLGSWAYQHFKPESRFNYLACAFCSLKIFRATWSYRGVNSSCACGVGPFPHGDWGAAMASRGYLLVLSTVGSSAAQPGDYVEQGQDLVFQMLENRPGGLHWCLSPSLSFPTLSCSLVLTWDVFTWTQWCPFWRLRGWIFCSPTSSGDSWSREICSPAEHLAAYGRELCFAATRYFPLSINSSLTLGFLGSQTHTYAS